MAANSHREAIYSVLQYLDRHNLGEAARTWVFLSHVYFSLSLMSETAVIYVWDSVVRWLSMPLLLRVGLSNFFNLHSWSQYLANKLLIAWIILYTCSLERESGLFFCLPYFEECFIHGAFDEAEEYFNGFTTVHDNMYSTNVVFVLRWYKFLEAVDE